MKPSLSPTVVFALLATITFAPEVSIAQSNGLTFEDANPQQYNLTARASEIDSRVKAHPEIGFLIDTKDGKPADLQQASVDTRVAPKGKLVIWLMGHNQQLFDRCNS